MNKRRRLIEEISTLVLQKINETNDEEFLKIGQYTDVLKKVVKEVYSTGGDFREFIDWYVQDYELHGELMSYEELFEDVAYVCAVEGMEESEVEYQLGYHFERFLEENKGSSKTIREMYQAYKRMVEEYSRSI